MPMREECKFFESRTYRNGETVRKCDLDLAPEAPWRCPENCQAYAPRLADVDWKYGTLVTPPTPAEPESLGSDPSIAALLDEAEEIVNIAGPRVREEVERETRSGRGRGPGAGRGGATGGKGGLGRFFRRRRGG